MTPVSLDPEKTAEAVRLYSEGSSMKRVGFALGTSSNAIRKILLGAGVKLRSTGGEGDTKARQHRRFFDIELATQMRRDGKSIAQIASGMPFGLTLVSERLREAGVDAPPRKQLDIARATAMRTQGSTISEISKATGFCEATVHTRLRAAGVAVPPPKSKARPKPEAHKLRRAHQPPKVVSPPDPPSARRLWDNPHGESAEAWQVLHPHGSEWARSQSIQRLHSRVRLMTLMGIPRAEISRITGLGPAILHRMQNTFAAV